MNSGQFALIKKDIRGITSNKQIFAVLLIVPPMVSASSPDMEPLRSRMKTNSVIKSPPSFVCAYIVARPKEGLVACGATFMFDPELTPNIACHD